MKTSAVFKASEARVLTPFVCLFLGSQVPNRYTVPLRRGIDINDLVQGDGTMFETDLDSMGMQLVTFCLIK